MSKNKKKKIVVFYHGKCTDGFTAAWAAWKFLKGKAEYIPLRHGEEISNFPQCVKDKEVYFLDFCPEEKLLLEVAAEAKSVLVLDHHKTAEEKCGHLTDFCHFDMTKSGAGISWDFFSKGEHGKSRLVSYVQDRDLWNNRLFETEAINLVVFQTDFSFENWDRLEERLNNEDSLNELLKEGQSLISFKKRILDSAKLNVQRLEMFGFQDVPVVNFSSFLVSDILNDICEEDYFAVAWHVGASGQISYSLRSKGEFDCAEIAAKCGGGGHKHAAAFRGILYPNELKK